MTEKQVEIELLRNGWHRRAEIGSDRHKFFKMNQLIQAQILSDTSMMLKLVIGCELVDGSLECYSFPERDTSIYWAYRHNNTWQMGDMKISDKWPLEAQVRSLLLKAEMEKIIDE
jgi:hypothetical protein